MPTQKVLYVFAGEAGIRYVERDGVKFFRTFRRLQFPRLDDWSVDEPFLGCPKRPDNARGILSAVSQDCASQLAKRFDFLVIVAPPFLLEMLRSSLPAGIVDKVVACIGRDLSRVRDQNLPRYLPLHIVYRGTPSEVRLMA